MNQIIERAEDVSPEIKLREVWEVIAGLDEQRMSEAGRTLVELHLKGDIPLEEYGSASYHLGTRAGQTATWLRNELQAGNDEIDEALRGKPRGHLIALHAELVATETAFTERALRAQEQLEPKGVSILGKTPPERTSTWKELSEK